MNDNIVSVIVPVFNAEKSLTKCVGSLIGQTYRNIEIIIVDDGSDDDSWSIIMELAERDGRIRCVSQRNGGVSAARNCGIALAHGRWVTFVDSDDWVEPDHISNLVRAAGPGCDCSISGYSIDFSDKSIPRLPSGHGAISPQKAVEEMLQPCFFQGFLWNKLFDMSIIRKYDVRLDTEVYYCEDLLFCAEYFSHCSKVCCINNTGYHYCQHYQSTVRALCDSDMAISRRMTAISALEKAEELCVTPAAHRLCAARRQTELAEILYRLPVGNARKKDIVKQLRSNFTAVLSSALPAKEKLKYCLTAFFPDIMVQRRRAKEQRILEEREKSDEVIGGNSE